MSIVLPVAEPVWSPIASAVDAPMWTRTLDQQIAALFANNEQGVWYDIDPAYCYQDAAGTVPAVVGQPVGLVLDRSKGLVLGPELVTNGDFSQGATGWTLAPGSGGSASVIDGAMVLSGGSASFPSGTQAAILATGKWYRATFDLLDTITAGSLGIRVGGVASQSTNFSSAGTKTCTVFSDGPDFRFIRNSGYTDTVRIDNISVRELHGNHAYQTTATSRPILSRHPVTGIRNLLSYSEQFDSSYWSKNSGGVLQNSAMAPDGSTTAEKLISTAETSQHWVYKVSITGVSPGVPYTFSCFLKAGEKRYGQLRILAPGTVASTGFDLELGSVYLTAAGTWKITPAGDGWFRCEVTGTSSESTLALYINVNNSLSLSESYTGDGTSGVYLWGAQLEAGSVATPYQKVVSAADVTEAGVTSVHYLRFDGADDYMSVGGLNPTGPLLICAGILSNVSAAGNNAWIIGNRATAQNESRGWQLSAAKAHLADGTLFESALPPGNFAPGVARVVCGVHSSSETKLRYDGAEVGSGVNAALGITTGTYTTSIGALDAGSSRYHLLDGRLYSLIVRAALSTQAQIKIVERYLAQKTGATLA